MLSLTYTPLLRLQRNNIRLLSMPSVHYFKTRKVLLWESLNSYYKTNIIMKKVYTINIKISIKLIYTIIVILLLVFSWHVLLKSKKPGIYKDIRRKICTFQNEKYGVFDKSIIKWCNIPISSRLECGGVPNNLLDITHPTLLVLDKPWKGYNVWLAATPYPQSLNDDVSILYENTSIFHANMNGNIFPTTFTSIKHNPIIYQEEASYNSDPDIIMENDTLYVVTRKVDGPDYKSDIVLQKSCDGEHWTEPLSLIKSNRLCLCPCIVKVNNKFYIYMFNTHFDERYSRSFGGVITDNLELWESNSLSNPKFKFVRSIKWGNVSNVWHGDVVYYNHKYYMIYCGTNYNYKILYGIGNIIDISKYLWLAVSDDGIHFKALPKPILKRSGMYRPTFYIGKSGLVTVYFSTENSDRGDDQSHYPGGNRIGMFQFYLADFK